MRLNRASVRTFVALVAIAAVAHWAPIAAQSANRAAQTTNKNVWLGVKLPPGFQPDVPPVILGKDYGPRPVTVPAGEERFTALSGEVL